jgi:hypothetical protein
MIVGRKTCCILCWSVVWTRIHAAIQQMTAWMRVTLEDMRFQTNVMDFISSRI